MSTLPFYRKRELSPLQRTRVSLGLNVDAKPKTNHTWLLRKAGLGNTAIEYLKLSADDQARRIVALYRSLNATERKAVTLDYLVMAAEGDVHHVWGVIQEEISRVKGALVETLVYMAAPDAVKVTIQRARKPDGVQDQKLLLRLYELSMRARTP